MQRVAEATDANTTRNILFTAGLSKALRCRAVFHIDNTKPKRMEAGAPPGEAPTVDVV
jgi:hypothetical protein